MLTCTHSNDATHSCRYLSNLLDATAPGNMTALQFATEHFANPMGLPELYVERGARVQHTTALNTAVCVCVCECMYVYKYIYIYIFNTYTCIHCIALYCRYKYQRLDPADIGDTPERPNIDISAGGDQPLSCPEMARVGQLLLNKGVWLDGNHTPYSMVEPSFVKEMFTVQHPNLGNETYCAECMYQILFLYQGH